jgi:hypothetical protein
MPVSRWGPMRALIFAILGIPVWLSAQQQTLQPMSADALEQVLAAKNTSDADLARQLSAMELTERLGVARLTQFETKCHGKECRNALIALADQSAFLHESRSEPESSLSQAPTETEQKEIVSKFLTFVGRMSHQMPNFIATRTTTRFEDWPQGLQIGQKIAGRTIPLQFSSQSRTTITYRNGQEDVARETASGGKAITAPDQGLFTWGLFGPMLSAVMVDASQSIFTWSRWEVNGTARRAVFHFAVPMGKSTYEVRFCCVPMSGGILVPLDRLAAYHGEIEMNPDDGTIAWITLIADMNESDTSALPLQPVTLGESPLSVANLAVEYAPVEIGGKQYTCPVHAVALSKAQTVITNKHDGPRLGPTRTYLNDVTFSGYRVFRSESRMLTDFKE